MDAQIKNISEKINILKQTLSLQGKNEDIERAISDLEQAKEIESISSVPTTNESFLVVPQTKTYLSKSKVSNILKNILSRSLDSAYKCEMLSSPQAGYITGNVYISRPDKQQDKIQLYNELGYEAKVRLTKGSSIIYEGNIYYRMLSFNPVRSSLTSFQENIQFNPIHFNQNFSYRHPHEFKPFSESFFFQTHPFQYNLIAIPDEFSMPCNGFCNGQNQCIPTQNTSYFCKDCNYALCNSCFQATKIEN